MEKNQNNPQSDNLDQKLTSDIQFLQEKIKERPINRKKLIRRSIITGSLAVIFGLIACVTFLLLEPIISELLYPEEKIQVVSFPEEEEELNPEDMAADDHELQIETAAGESAKAALQNGTAEAADGTTEKENNTSEAGKGGSNKPSQVSATGEAPGIKAVSIDGEDSQTDAEEEEISLEEEEQEILRTHRILLSKLGEVTGKLKKSMVTVTSVTSGTNWINDTLQDSGTTSGLVVADNGKELLILCDYEAMNKAEKILVNFYEGDAIEAELKQKDKVTGLCVLSLPLNAIDPRIRVHMEYAFLGSSQGTGLIGQPIIAIGAPMGTMDSVAYGFVTSQGSVIDLVDTSYKLITTDIYGSKNASGILANWQGQVVGILRNGYQSSDMPNQLCAIGVTELKRTIERISNGDEVAYLGVHGMEISKILRAENNLPLGAYIATVEMGSPAMEAGLQSGDIITSVNNSEVKSYSDLTLYLSKRRPSQPLKLVVARQVQNGFAEMETEAELGHQPK